MFLMSFLPNSASVFTKLNLGLTKRIPVWQVACFEQWMFETYNLSFQELIFHKIEAILNDLVIDLLYRKSDLGVSWVFRVFTRFRTVLINRLLSLSYVIFIIGPLLWVVKIRGMTCLSLDFIFGIFVMKDYFLEPPL